MPPVPPTMPCNPTLQKCVLSVSYPSVCTLCLLPCGLGLWLHFCPCPCLQCLPILTPIQQCVSISTTSSGLPYTFEHLPMQKQLQIPPASFSYCVWGLLTNHVTSTSSYYSLPMLVLTTLPALCDANASMPLLLTIVRFGYSRLRISINSHTCRGYCA